MPSEVDAPSARDTAITAFGRTLSTVGVDRIFGLPGSAIMSLYNFLHGRDDIIHVLSSHETGASYMANAWAQVTGKIGVCVATTGPGALNLMTGVATAYSESVPLLAVTGQVPLASFSTRAYQESTPHGRSIDAVAAFAPVTKQSVLATSANHFIRLLTSSIAVACDGRPGPVHISVPSDVWEQEITLPGYERLIEALADPGRGRLADRPVISAVAERLSTAHAPLILLGNGATTGRAGHAALQLAERFAIPVVTTARGKGAVPSGHPSVIGGLGSSGRPDLLAWLAERRTDVLLAIGTSLGAFSLGPAARAVPIPDHIVLVNSDPEERGAVWPADQVVNASARPFCEDLCSALDRRGVRPFPSFQPPPTARPGLGSYPDTFEDRMHPAAALMRVRDALPDSAVIIPDAGNHWIWAMRLFENHFEGGTLVGRSLGGMGQGLAAAVGAAAADPTRVVVSVTGDGCVLMHGGEMAAAVGAQVPVVWVVLNDSSLSRIHIAQVEDFDGKIISTALPPVDIAGLAESMGVFSRRVTELGQIGEAVQAAVKASRPALVELVVGRASPFRHV